MARLLALMMVAVTTAPAFAQLIVSSYFNSAVYQYNPNGFNTQQAVIGASYTNGLLAPTRATIGPDNNLYIANQGYDTNTNNILKYNLTTGVYSTFVSSSALTTVAGGYYGPAGIRFDGDGNLYVARNGGISAAANSGAIDKFDSSGNYITTIASNLNQPTALTINGTDLYVSELRGQAGGAGSIDKISNFATTPSAATPFILGSTELGALESPTGTTFGPDGSFYVADVSYVSNGPGSKVLKYTVSGGVATRDNTFLISQPYQFTSDVAFRDDGSLLVASLGTPFTTDPDTGDPNSVPGTITSYTSTGSLTGYVLVDYQISPSSLSFNPVPEPMLLLAVAGGCLLIRRRLK